MMENKSILDIPGMNLKQLQEKIVEEIRAGKSLLGTEGLLTPLIKSALEASMGGEIQYHLDDPETSAKNRRNGKSKKIVKL